MEHGQVIRPSPGLHIVVDDLRDPPRQMVRCLDIQSPHPDMELRLPGNNIDSRASLCHAAGQGHHGRRVRLPGDKQIDSLVYLVHDHQGVNAELRLGAVAAAALYLQDKGVQGSRVNPHCISQLPRPGHGLDMEPECGVHFRVLQKAVLHQDPGPGACLLAGLEHQLDRALQGALPLFQYLSRPQEHGRVAVMAAHMSISIPGSKLQITGFPNGKCIHIRPQQDAGAAMADHGRHSLGPLHPGEPCFHKIPGHLFRQVPAAVLPRYSHLIQPFSDMIRCLRQLHPDLRYLVQVPPVRCDLFPELLRSPPDLGRRHSHNLSPVFPESNNAGPWEGTGCL